MPDTVFIPLPFLAYDSINYVWQIMYYYQNLYCTVHNDTDIYRYDFAHEFSIHLI